MSLPTLPSELLEVVFEHALAPSSTMALTPPPGTASLLCLSHSWRKFLLPRFWTSVTIVSPQDWVHFFGRDVGLFVGEEGQQRWRLVKELMIVSGVHPPIRSDPPLECDLVGGKNLRGGPTTFIVDLDPPTYHRLECIAFLPHRAQTVDAGERGLWEYHTVHAASYMKSIAANISEETGEPTPITFEETSSGLLESLANCREAFYSSLFESIQPLHIYLTLAEYINCGLGCRHALGKPRLIGPPYPIFDLTLAPNAPEPVDDRWSRELRTFQKVRAVMMNDILTDDEDAQDDLAHVVYQLTNHNSPWSFSTIVLRGFSPCFLKRFVNSLREQSERVRPRRALIAQRASAGYRWAWPDGVEGSYDVVSKTWAGRVE